MFLLVHGFKYYFGYDARRCSLWSSQAKREQRRDCSRTGGGRECGGCAGRAGAVGAGHHCRKLSEDGRHDEVHLHVAEAKERGVCSKFNPEDCAGALFYHSPRTLFTTNHVTLFSCVHRQMLAASSCIKLVVLTHAVDTRMTSPCFVLWCASCFVRRV